MLNVQTNAVRESWQWKVKEGNVKEFVKGGIDDVQELQLEPEELEEENNNMYRIIGIIDYHYIV
jgi:hypothetical protein